MGEVILGTILAISLIGTLYLGFHTVSSVKAGNFPQESLLVRCFYFALSVGGLAWSLTLEWSSEIINRLSIAYHMDIEGAGSPVVFTPFTFELAKEGAIISMFSAFLAMLIWALKQPSIYKVRQPEAPKLTENVRPFRIISRKRNTRGLD